MVSTFFYYNDLNTRLPHTSNLQLSQHMGASTGYGNEGDYIANPRNMTAYVPTFDAARNLACVCLTSAYDVAQFVVRALDM